MSFWPLIRLLPKKTNFTYVKFARLAAFLSIVAVLASFASMFTAGFRENPIAVFQSTPGTLTDKFNEVFDDSFNFGIDFKGGTLIEFRAPQDVDVEAVRNAVNGLELGEVTVQTMGDASHVQLRYESPAQGAAEAAERVQVAIIGVEPTAEFLARDVVGPKVSGELFTGGLIALGLAILLMLIYIWIRFPWQFGLGGVLALFHDVILTLGLFSIFRFEFTLTIIAALLTIIGYSMNDTVVVFDRMRENLRKFKKMPLGDLVDLSLNETLSRTIITGCTALFALIGLYFVGGEALEGFAIAMIFGIVMGTYSSLYVAAPAVLIWGVGRPSEKDGKAETPAPQAAR